MGGEEGQLSRRRFLKVLGAAGGGTVALAGCAGGEPERLIPYLIPPEDQIPGIATWYASTCRECPAGCGLHVKVREGRAIKLEGNPDHPVNAGKLCARGHAALQGLYNPDRVRGPMARAADGTFQAITWDDALARVAERLGAGQGAAAWFVTGAESGSFDSLVDDWLAALGSTGRVVYEPFGSEALRHASREVFGVEGVPSFDLGAARYIISFGADFLETWLSPMALTRGFVQSHGYRDGRMGKFVHVEPRLSLTGMNADEWVSPVPGTEGLLALAMAHVILTERLVPQAPDVARLRPLLEQHAPGAVAARCGVPAETIERLAREFAAGASVALPGGVGTHHEQAHGTAAAALVLNYVAGNVGRTVHVAASAGGAARGGYGRLVQLVEAMRGGQVSVLFVHGANPAYASPAALGFAAALRQVPFKVSFSRFLDETAQLADLILPDHDPLEQWNDVVASPGVRGLQQPVMQPVFDTRQTGDVLLDLAQRLSGRVAARLAAASFKDYLRDAWRGVQREVGAAGDFEAFWTQSLQRGGVWTVPRTPARATLGAAAGRLSVAPWDAPADRLTLIAYPSPVFHDGRGANRPWLQELPDPVTKITWGTWVELHPETAAEFGIAEGDVVELTSETGSITAPAYLYEGVRPGVAAVPTGQGHTAFGRYAQGRGANAYSLLPAAATAFGGVAHYAGVEIRPSGDHVRLPKAEGTPRQLGRGIARARTLAAMRGDVGEEEHAAHAAAPVPEHIEDVLQAWEEAQRREWANRGNYAGEHPRWGMVIDLSRCTGCSACVTACHSENNIPTVGPELVQRGREMSWLRIERYFEGGGEHPFETRVVPMLCQHCANAPCEPVCPVFAAYHTPDGLNGQVYNRCVGTRYCSNNCPYKVRYFNWFDYQAPEDPRTFAFPEPLHLLLNPDVTMRSKGVMEKCTFCVQRIRGAQHQARMEDRLVRDGEIRTACQQTCPADAIVFGDLRSPDSRAAQLAADPRAYHVLEDLNTKPGVVYLAKVRNVVEA
jgi:molybdopterin-containing oxidoreductase family iron-sulfur binding subunit